MMLRREALWEYLRGALWALPSAAVVIAIAAGAVLSRVTFPAHSALHRVVFQGTVDDARTLLIGIAATMITVIALVLGLTVVTLQLASTQYSPRLLRDFLRDRPNQVVLSIFVATFAYSTAGLYTVGVAGGSHTSDFPRLAVSGAIGLLFVSLGALVYEVHHVAHSMQIDEIMRRVERHTLGVIAELAPATSADAKTTSSTISPTAVPVLAHSSGYVQTLHVEPVVATARAQRAYVHMAVRVGDHVVGGTTPVAWVWRERGDRVEPGPFVHVLAAAVPIGFERTLEQDAGFGIRQLVDVASKALSPAVNDPYTAVQAVDHLSVVICALSRSQLGTIVLSAGAPGEVAVAGFTFAEYLDLACAQIRRYGSTEPIVARALLRLLRAVAATGSDELCRGLVAHQVALIQADFERDVRQDADLSAVLADATEILAEIGPAGPSRPGTDQ